MAGKVEIQVYEELCYHVIPVIVQLLILLLIRETLIPLTDRKPEAILSSGKVKMPILLLSIVQFERSYLESTILDYSNQTIKLCFEVTSFHIRTLNSSMESIYMKLVLLTLSYE